MKFAGYENQEQLYIRLDIDAWLKECYPAMSGGRAYNMARIITQYVLQREGLVACADCGEQGTGRIYWCSTSARCTDCHSIRMNQE